MIIDISMIPEQGESVAGEEPAQILDLAGDAFARNIQPVRYDLQVQKTLAEVIVQGRLSIKLELACARCADFYSTTLKDSSFLRDYPIEPGMVAVDITPDIREAILLSMPAFGLCRAACKGLCRQCGKNLNEGACGCKPEKPDTAWGALDDLKLKDRP